MSAIFADIVSLWHQYRLYALLCIVLISGSISLLINRRAESGQPWTTDREKASRETSDHQGRDVVEKSQCSQPSIKTLQAVVATRQTGSRTALKSSTWEPKRVLGSKTRKTSGLSTRSPSKISPVIFYFSLTKTTEALAHELKGNLDHSSRKDPYINEASLRDIASIDYEDFFERVPQSKNQDGSRHLYLLLLPSYDIDTILDNFLQFLKETHNDFRIDTSPLSNLVGYSVFGLGDRENWPTEAEGFCSQSILVDKWMAKLTARKRIYPLGMGDVKSDMNKRFGEWQQGLLRTLTDIKGGSGLGEGVPGSGDALESDEEEEEDTSGVNQINSNVKSTKRPNARKSDIGDLEDMGGKSSTSFQSADSSPLPTDFTTSSQSQTTPKAMVPQNSPTYTALTKQGYTIVGSHSGVKICRWTKSALRGRGSCYKYTFYGIASHLCMETTPSLSCSNKCVFCWRHGTNPVGTTWRWQVDPPDLIFNGAKEGHYKKIKMMRGVPGVRAERFQEAMQIRHCALSLVGEPIFYPHINEFVRLLHQEHISSFLVCNAQHPDQLASLNPVTQLYVSIDASNAESLRRIDRPLHRDYWQRFMKCLDIICEKRFRMRTVYRLTLVKGFNIDEEVEGYADLVARGLPCFVEIKGVTYCGTSTSASAGLTMQNVPFYEEIVAFVEALNKALAARGLEYGIAAEHAHSCCALIASSRFLVEGKWHTLIDYDEFFKCLESGREFRPEDYMGAPTPEWASWGQGGFDPRDVRVDRKGKPIEKE